MCVCAYVHQRYTIRRVEKCVTKGVTTAPESMCFSGASVHRCCSALQPSADDRRYCGMAVDRLPGLYRYSAGQKVYLAARVTDADIGRFRGR